MAVTRCVCFRQRFADLLPLVRRSGWTTLDEISRGTGCGSGCRGCRPYLAQMLATGATCFRVAMDGEPPQPCPPDPWDRD